MQPEAVFIHQLVLRDFRNYDSLELSLDRGLTTFVGKNGQGKTNLLEAVHFLSTSKSPRTPRDRELIRWEQEFLCARADFATREAPDNSAELIVTRQGEKRARFNGAECRQLKEWLGRLNVVAFFPQDLQLVSGQPAVRRQFLDLTLSTLDSRYHYHWTAYRHVLNQRNALLRELRVSGRSSSALPELSDQLAGHGAEIIVRRYGYVADLAPKAVAVHRRLSREREALTLRYECRVQEAPLGDAAAVRQVLSDQLLRGASADIERGTTQFGPHRDDLAITLQEKDLRRFSSQGQQRSAALALRLAAAEVAEERLSDPPLLLLDDALSELDAERRFELLDLAAQREQVLLTTTDSELQRLSELSTAALYRIQDAKVEAV